MLKKAISLKRVILLLTFIILGILTNRVFAQSPETRSQTYLPNMSWVDAQEAFKRTDMVIIPLGSIEQHGPQNPLGADFYQALEIAKIVGEKTGVIVAPVLFVGYSPYHAGFPGTMYISSETMQRVVFEAAQSLIQHGFKKFMLLNGHGGNKTVVSWVMYRINQETPATCVSIGVGSPLHESEEEPEEKFFDWHGGLSETSKLLYLTPNLVNMKRAEKPIITLPEKLQKIIKLRKQEPSLMMILNAELGTPESSQKSGASHQISSNGVWSFADPTRATKERGEKEVKQYVDRIVRFIEAWKKLEETE